MTLMRFWLAALMCLCLGTSGALAKPEPLWSRPDISIYASELVLVPSNNIALAVIEDGDHGDGNPSLSYESARYKIAVLDLSTGQTLHLIQPQIADQPDFWPISDLVADDRVIVALKSDSNGQYLFACDAGTFDPLWQVRVYAADFPDHVVPEGLASTLLIAGDFVLVPTRLRGTYVDTGPLMQVYDLQTGDFVQSLGMMDIDSNAKPGWFGGRPAAPDHIFHNAVASGSLLLLQDGLKEDITSGKILSYDLLNREIGPESAIPEYENRQLFLSAADEARLYFALYVPLSSRQNVLKQGGLLGISRGDGAQVTTYADPFPVNGEEMSMAAYVMTYTEAGAAPFVGSFFPGGVMTSASHVVAGVPQLPGKDEGVMGLAIFAANSGELQDMILPEPGDDREISRPAPGIRPVRSVAGTGNYRPRSS